MLKTQNLLSEEAIFLLKNGWLEITGTPNLEKIKKDLEKELGRELTLFLKKQEGNYLEATLLLQIQNKH